MNSGFVGSDGYPCELEASQFGQELIKAIRGLPGADTQAKDTIEKYAWLLYGASVDGRDAERPHSQPATQGASFQELKKLERMSKKLVEHIGKMRQPAIQAIQLHGIDLKDISARLTNILDTMGGARADLQPALSARRRPKKIEASQVTDQAAIIFEMVTGKPPTRTTDWKSNEVTGEWPDFVRAVFGALHVDASVESQVAGQKKNTNKTD